MRCRGTARGQKKTAVAQDCCRPERTGGSPRLRFAPWCAPLPAASASRWQGSLPAGSRQAAQYCCRQAAHRVTIALAEIMSGRAEAPGCVFAPWCAPLPAASASRWQGSLPAGCRPAAQYRFRQAAHCFPTRRIIILPTAFSLVSLLSSLFSLLTSHFSLLTSHFPLPTSHFLLLSTLHFLLSRAAGGSPRLRFRTLGAHGVSIASQDPLPAGCRQAAHRALTSPLRSPRSPLSPSIPPGNSSPVRSVFQPGGRHINSRRRKPPEACNISPAARRATHPVRHRQPPQPNVAQTLDSRWPQAARERKGWKVESRRKRGSENGRTDARKPPLAISHPWYTRRQHRVAGPFTRRLPPGGSSRSHFSLLTSLRPPLSRSAPHNHHSVAKPDLTESPIAPTYEIISCTTLP
ncbi:MAG: hypothetical protein RLZZ436_1618 [Planctomycetota bacterium]